MKTNIALIGYMGTGKTAVGRALAERQGKEFIEMDSLIEQKAGKSIPDIFSQDGEIAFRELEIAVAREVASRNDVVIACGGGLVLNQINVDRLRENAVMVCLTAGPDVILQRVSGEAGQRPLLEVENPERTIAEMLSFRQPFYQRAADITIDTSKLDVGSVAGQIMEKLRDNASFNR